MLCTSQPLNHTQGARFIAFLLVFLAACLWGTVGVITRWIYGVADTHPASLGFFRMAFSVPALWLGAWLMGIRNWQVRGSDWLRMAALGGAMSSYQVFYMAAVERAGVTIAVLITLCTAPLMVAVISATFLGEQLTFQTALAMALALFGTTLLVGFDVSADATAQTLQGAVLALGSAFSYAVVTLISRNLAQRYHPLQPVAIGFTIGAFTSLIAALPFGLRLSYPPLAWALLVYLGVVPTALGYVIFLRGMQRTPATTASLISLGEPLTSTTLAALLLGERLSTEALIGAGLLLGALALLAMDEHTLKRLLSRWHPRQHGA